MTLTGLSTLSSLSKVFAIPAMVGSDFDVVRFTLYINQGTANTLHIQQAPTFTQNIDLSKTITLSINQSDDINGLINQSDSYTLER
jgi:hypothetical protein